MTINRMVYIADDKSLNIEGETLFNVNVDWIDDGIHAIQWHGDEYGGEIEYKPIGGPYGQKPHNTKITELGEYQSLVDYFYEERQRRLDAQIAAQEAAEAARDYWQELRTIRDDLLFRSDWTQLPDVALTEEKASEWLIYRQSLRDLPEIVTDPKPMVLSYYNEEIHPDWPIKP